LVIRRVPIVADHFYGVMAGLPKRHDKSKRYDGVIVHSAGSFIYQHAGEIIVMHSLSDFYETLPEIGTNKSIVYDAQGKAQASSAGKLTQNHSTE